MIKKTRARSKIFKSFLEWLVKKLFWFVFVPVMSILSYYTQIRPYILVNYGLYITGFMDGALFMISILIFALWVISKILR